MILNEKYHNNMLIVDKITNLLNSPTAKYKKLYSKRGDFIEIKSHELRILLENVDRKLVPICS